jgi:hypothetical protein
MRNIDIYRTTSNRSTYNKLRKFYLAGCDRCPWHDCENLDHDYYGSSCGRIKHPNWKLVSKREKQWMGKPIKFTKRYSVWVKDHYWTEIKF